MSHATRPPACLRPCPPNHPRPAAPPRLARPAAPEGANGIACMYMAFASIDRYWRHWLVPSDLPTHGTNPASAIILPCVQAGGQQRSTPQWPGCTRSCCGAARRGTRVSRRAEPAGWGGMGWVEGRREGKQGGGRAGQAGAGRSTAGLTHGASHAIRTYASIILLVAAQ